ncbi:MAG: radical SAM protein [ANME-2 cluster archaeon]|nr:radical SAM protein [ANME-2 cluster archaeon]MBC2706767.1 radical SAM protein [ANME-2 cluster archaeon]MBC2747655.1 radical SAM protein [ANME-2 cluster archaeon]
MYAYGPVPSRRLGRSLGVSPIPHKTCSYNCIYCQLGQTGKLQVKRESFYPKEDILSDIEKVMNPANVDYITFVGDGEPTLCKDLGWLIKSCKQQWQIPVAVITNGSLFFMEDVRQDLKSSDVVLPTLDAGSEGVYRTLNRPHGSIGFEEMLQGQVDFRKEYPGKIWLEVMLVKGVNDSDGSLLEIKDAIEQVKPDRIYISVPIRPPAKPGVRPPEPERIIRAHEILNATLDLTDYESGEFGLDNFPDLRTTIIEICSRHPLREEQARDIEGRFPGAESIDTMLSDGNLVRVEYQNISYLLPANFTRKSSLRSD